MERIINHITLLKNQSFEGWSDAEINGYITALTTIEQFTKPLQAELETWKSLAKHLEEVKRGHNERINKLVDELAKQKLYAELGKLVYDHAVNVSFGNEFKDIELMKYLKFNGLIKQIKEREQNEKS
jgi:hypothetical protein